MFEEAAVKARKLRRELQSLEPQLVLACDRWALKGVLGDLLWMDENLTIIARHQKNRSLGEDMGYWLPPGMGPKQRLLPPRMTIARAHRKELRESRLSRRTRGQ